MTVYVHNPIGQCVSWDMTVYFKPFFSEDLEITIKLDEMMKSNP
jgi:hypothetical protein